jgi:hypothetical protein
MAAARVRPWLPQAREAYCGNGGGYGSISQAPRRVPALIGRIAVRVAGGIAAIGHIPTVHVAGASPLMPLDALHWTLVTFTPFLTSKATQPTELEPGLVLNWPLLKLTWLSGRTCRPAGDGTGWHAMDRYLDVSPVNAAIARAAARRRRPEGARR